MLGPTDKPWGALGWGNWEQRLARFEMHSVAADASETLRPARLGG